MDNLISVIIPSYNRKDFIDRAIDSVLKQNYKEIEILIIDDGSTDGTYEYLNEKYIGNNTIKIFRNKKNSGAGYSRKSGYEKSNGKYVIFMDDDDYYTNFEFFNHALDEFKKNKNISMVSSSSIKEYVNENRFEESKMNIKGLINKSDYLSKFQLEYMKSNSTFTTIFSKEALEKANFKQMEMVNDSSIYLRALLAGDAYILDEISGIYRVHSKNITFSLKIDFIIENLIEKKKIYDEIKQKKLLEDPDLWLKRQVILTCKYFVENNKLENNDFEILTNWCNENCGNEASKIIECLENSKRINKKKVFLMAYARKNFGDDLFIQMILKRNPQNDYYMKIREPKYLSNLDNYSNLHVIQGEDTDEELSKIDVNEYDAYVYVGGSIFMEGGKVYNLSEKFYNFIKKCKEAGKPFSYVSCNYGPYQTEEYFKLSQRTFKIATDICFRDKYSYNLFKEIETVRYAPDFAFTYEIDNHEKIKNSIGITIIDLSIRKDLATKEEEYIKMLVNNINLYLQNGKKVYLYTFCSHESDERTLDLVLKHFKNNQNVIDVRYDGNIDKFINIYSKMEYMICARFHAIILSILSKQKIQIMSYSKKIDNVIKDLELNLPIINFKALNKNILFDLNKFGYINDEKLKKIIEEAKQQELKIN